MTTDLKDMGASAQGWTNWKLINTGYTLKKMRAILNADGRIELLGINGKEELLHCCQTDIKTNQWSDWEVLHEQVDVYEVGSWDDGRLNVIFIGRDNTLREMRQKAPNVKTAAEWEIGESSQENVQPDSLSITEDYEGRLHIFWCDKDSVVRWAHQPQTNMPLNLVPNICQGDPGAIIAVDDPNIVVCWGRSVEVNQSRSRTVTSTDVSRKIHAKHTAAGRDMYGRVNVFGCDEGARIIRNNVQLLSDREYMSAGTDVTDDGRVYIAKNGKGAFERFTIWGGVLYRKNQMFPSGDWGGLAEMLDTGPDLFHFTNFDGLVSTFTVDDDLKLLNYRDRSLENGEIDVIDMQLTAKAVTAVENLFGHTTCFAVTPDGDVVMSTDTKKGEAPPSVEWHHKVSRNSEANVHEMQQLLQSHKPDRFQKKLDLGEPLTEVFQVADHMKNMATSVIDDVEKVVGKTVHAAFFEAERFEELLDSHIEAGAKDIHKAGNWLENDLGKLLHYGEDLLTDIEDKSKFDREKAEAELTEIFVKVTDFAEKLAGKIDMPMPINVKEFKEVVLPMMTHFPEKVIQKLHLNLPATPLTFEAEIIDWEWKNGLGNVRHDVIWGVAGTLAVLRLLRSALDIIIKGFPCKLDLGLNVHIAASMQAGAAITADIGIGVGAGVDADIPIIGAGAEADGGGGNVTLFDLDVASVTLSELVFGPVMVSLDFLVEMLGLASKLIREHWHKQS